MQNNEEHFVGTFKVIDGDTVRHEGQKLRLIGIDAPEYSQKCKGNKGVWPCGRMATRKLRSIVGRSANLICKGKEIDKYGRPLVTCFEGARDINAIMVRDGLAVAYGAYYGEEREARKNKKGIWQGQFMRPQDWRRVHYGSFSGEYIKEVLSNFWVGFSAFCKKTFSNVWG